MNETVFVIVLMKACGSVLSLPILSVEFHTIHSKDIHSRLITTQCSRKTLNNQIK